ncbi:MAG: FadD3 family acyl-CoA ligase [Acidimicrobiales bacterium]|nr:FadD3 family acyl-CoA ligase [Acidimicrobiales bacterium]
MSSAPWATIPELIDDAATRFADNEAMVDGDVRWTFAEFRDEIHRGARALMASGIEAGDRVAVWAPNIWEWAIAALGVHVAGGVIVPINTRFKGREANYVLTNSGARMLFTVTDFLDTDYVAALRGTGEDLPGTLEEIVVMRGTCPPDTTPFADFIARADDVPDDDRAARTAAITGDDLCHIMFTSGTTGDPKGAMLIHSAICRAYLVWAEGVGLDQDRYLIVNPFFHSFGLNAGILACLMTGSTIIPHPVFDIPSVMQRIAEERVSAFPGPPAIYQTILNTENLDDFDLSSLRLAVTGAAPVPVSLIEEMRARLGFETIITAYGLTESSGMATMCRVGDSAEVISGSSGRAIDGVEVLIVDRDGNEVPRGEPGEIVVRGYNLMKGYLGDPEKTAETIDRDGWLHTGDIGVMDEAGNVDITDRVKDMFINGGFNAYPAEIENLMLNHREVGQVAVVGVPDQRLGEVGYAFVVPTPGASARTDPDAAADELLAWCKAEMANYKAPRHITFVDEFPLNASGKVLKYELRDRAVASLS